MILKIYFERSDEVFEKPLNKQVNGFINFLLGENNEYHGKFSEYCVSSMQGGKMDKDGKLTFKDGAFLRVSSPSMDFLGKIMLSLSKNRDLSVCSLQYKNFELDEFGTFSDYDVIRMISPLSLRVHRRVVTYNDDDFIEVLTSKSRKKLIHNGISEEEANTIEFELFHGENAKTKAVQIGGSANISSMVMLVVKGSEKARKTLYNLGLGGCCGFGFGAIEIIR